MASERPPTSCVEDRYRQASLRSAFLCTAPHSWRPPLLHQTFGHGEGIKPTCRHKPTEFNKINPAFARLHLCHPTMWNLETHGQVALRKCGTLSCRAEFRTKGGVFSSVSRFFHCPYYRNMLGCSQIRNNAMLTLRHDWRRITWGAIAADLLRQATTPTLEGSFGNSLAGATVELTAMHCFGRERFESEVGTLSESTWRIRDATFAYLPTVDDDAMIYCEELTMCSPMLIVLVPPNHQGVFTRACQSVLGRRTPIIWSLDGFISYRMVLTPPLLNMPPNRVLRELLTRCNRRTTEAHCDGSILIDIPSDLG
jgi:hypothetical protein